MKRQAVCPVCGREFTAGRKTQQYCSAHCRQYAYRHRERPPQDGAPAGTVLRAFCCLRCGTAVTVTNWQDKRTKFCSSRCERLYWKHSKEQHVRSAAAVYTFRCRNCGTAVTVTDAADRRRVFCSAACRREWSSRHRRRTR